MSAGDLISVEVACATPEKQRIVKLEVAPGTTARRAVRESGLQTEFPELDFATLALGIFGEVVPDGRALKPGDRVEVYRPLLHEPRELRRLQIMRSRKKLGKRPGTPDPRKRG